MWRFLKLVGCSLGLVVLAVACGESSDVSSVPGCAECSDADAFNEVGMVEHQSEIDELAAIGGRADLRMDSSLSGGDGVFEVTASISVLDKRHLVTPTISVQMGEAVSVVGVPDLCEASDEGLVCVLGFFDSGSAPLTSEFVVFEVRVAEGVVDPWVMLTATSEDNPVSNDPDPSNNVVTLQLG